MDCSICLEGIQQEEQTIVIDSCQHTFHQRCVEPWFLRHSTCPNCRGPTQNQEELLSQERRRDLGELDRVYLTYILFTWILHHIHGVQFQTHSNRIHSFLSRVHWNDIVPLRFAMTPRNKNSLTSIKSLRVYCITREQILFHHLYPEETHRAIHRNPRTLQIQTGIEQQLVEFFESIS
jgi:hypothetical protein